MTAAPLYRTRISGTGSYIPERVLTNADLEKMVDTNDQWIVERTGIKNRHLARADQVTTDLAYEAAIKALEAAKLSATDLDMIIFATVTPDQVMPSAACVLQAKLGARTIMAFDISAACSGFLYAMSIADQFVKAGQAKHVLIIGAEILSRIINYKDRETCILFGDGAGAMVLSRSEGQDNSMILSTHIQADGGLGDLLVLPAGGSKMPYTTEVLETGGQYMRMKGRENIKHAIRAMTQCCQDALDSNGVAKKDVDWLIPHQANMRILESVAHYFDIPMEKVVITLPETGNTSAATIPTTFDIAVRDGRIQRGQNVLLTAFGGGLTSGSALVRY